MAAHLRLERVRSQLAPPSAESGPPRPAAATHAAASSGQRLRVAAICSVYNPLAHADVIVTKFLKGQVRERPPVPSRTARAVRLRGPSIVALPAAAILDPPPGWPAGWLQPSRARCVIPRPSCGSRAEHRRRLSPTRGRRGLDLHRLHPRGRHRCAEPAHVSACTCSTWCGALDQAKQAPFI